MTAASRLDVGVKWWTKQSKWLFSLDGNYAPRTISHSQLMTKPSQSLHNSAGWLKINFPQVLIINNLQCVKLGQVQISWIPLTSQTDWWWPDSGCCGVLSVAAVFHGSWCAQSGDLSWSLAKLFTPNSHSSQLSLSQLHPHTRSILLVALQLLKVFCFIHLRKKH